MPVTIDEVTAEIDPTGVATFVSQPSGQNQNSSDMELLRYRELQNHLAIRANRLRAE